MSLLLLGLNHETAPIDLRERLSLTGCALPMALQELREGEGNPIQEAVILSTCNRLEIIVVARQASAGRAHLEHFIARLQNIPLDDLCPHLYLYEDEAAVKHLMRVACGLDSMILGEPQILGQVTQAFGDAQNANMTGPVLSHLMAQAIHAGKRARTETEISRYTTSVSHAGALLVLDQLAGQPDPHVLVMGAGEMAVLAAKALKNHGVDNIVFINRTYSRAAKLVEEIGGRAMSWYELDDSLIWADAVITATGAPHTVIHPHEVETALPHREGRPLLFVDIAVPRDVEVEVGDLPGVQRRDIDDLRSIVDANAAQREAAIPDVMTIISKESRTFYDWYHSRQVTPVIQDLRRWASQLATLEVEQALNRLGDEIDEKTAKVVQRLAHRLVNKLLHEPTVRLRDQAAEGNGYGYAHTVADLFGLDDPELPEAASPANGQRPSALNCQQCHYHPNGHSDPHDPHPTQTAAGVGGS